LSFYIIGLFWNIHHHYFRYILKFDPGLFLLNLTLLLLIAFLPFPTYLLGHYGDQSIVAAFYAATLSLLQVLYLLLWWYATSRHRLISPTLEQGLITFERWRRLLQLSIFVISIGLAFIHLYLAILAWIAVTLISFIVPMERGRSIRHGDE
jgi:TMEM175 potassium channel family protein